MSAFAEWTQWRKKSRTSEPWVSVLRWCCCYGNRCRQLHGGHGVLKIVTTREGCNCGEQHFKKPTNGNVQSAGGKFSRWAFVRCLDESFVLLLLIIWAFLGCCLRYELYIFSISAWMLLCPPAHFCLFAPTRQQPHSTFGQNILKTPSAVGIKLKTSQNLTRRLEKSIWKKQSKTKKIYKKKLP